MKFLNMASIVLIACALLACSKYPSPRDAEAIQRFVTGNVIGGLINMEWKPLSQSGWREGMQEYKRIQPDPRKLLKTGLRQIMLEDNYCVTQINFGEKSGEFRVTVESADETKRGTGKEIEFIVTRGDGNLKIVRSKMGPTLSIAPTSPPLS